MKNQLEVRNLVQELSDHKGQKQIILKNITFSIPKGSLTGFVGINGAGKTTVFKSILGFIHSQQGEVRFQFKNTTSTQNLDSPLSNIKKGPSIEEKHLFDKIGYMPERPYFYEFLTGFEFLKLHWELRGLKIESDFQSKIDQILSRVDLMDAKFKRLKTYSKGMLQRVGIAQAILHQPEFLILDEPMSGLDPDGRALLKGILTDLHSQQTTIFFSSHLLQDIEELCDYIVIIERGEVLFEGLRDQLLGNGNETLEKAFSRLRKKGF